MSLGADAKLRLQGVDHQLMSLAQRGDAWCNLTSDASKRHARTAEGYLQFLEALMPGVDTGLGFSFLIQNLGFWVRGERLKFSCLATRSGAI